MTRTRHMLCAPLLCWHNFVVLQVSWYIARTHGASAAATYPVACLVFSCLHVEQSTDRELLDFRDQCICTPFPPQSNCGTHGNRRRQIVMSSTQLHSLRSSRDACSGRVRVCGCLWKKRFTRRDESCSCGKPTTSKSARGEENKPSFEEKLIIWRIEVMVPKRHHNGFTFNLRSMCASHNRRSDRQSSTLQTLPAEHDSSLNSRTHAYLHVASWLTLEFRYLLKYYASKTNENYPTANRQWYLTKSSERTNTLTTT